MRFLKPKIIIIVIILIIIIGVVLSFVLKEKELPYNFSAVEISNVVQEVSAVGQVKKGEEINLSFKGAGRIETIYVEVGDSVDPHKDLAKLETIQLYFQLNEAQASLEVAEAELNKLLAGATPEEIQIAQTDVRNTEIDHENAKQKLEDVEAQAEDDLETAYEDALNNLNDAYLKLYNAHNTAESVYEDDFGVADNESLTVKSKNDAIKQKRDIVKSYLDVAGADPTDENIDTALTETKSALSYTYDALMVIRDTCDKGTYNSSVPSADKASLDTEKSNINTALTNVANSQQTISSTKLTNKYNINVAQASVSSTEGSLQAVRDQLALTVAEPRQEDIALYQAQVDQATAQVSLLSHDIQEASLRSPIKGEITKIEKEIGEQAATNETIISLLPTEPFQIETDISEADIGKVDINDPVEITLDAFPEEVFSGKVIEIEPAETVIAGVVYYKTKISLETEKENIKPGMTANVNIISDKKENVLVVPRRAIIERDSKKFIRVLTGDEFKEVEVITGLKGSEGNVEILSGLKEGDKVITFLKED